MASVLGSRILMLAASATILIVAATASAQSIDGANKIAHISKSPSQNRPRTIAGITWQPSLAELIKAPKKNAKPIFLVRVLGDLEGDL